MRAFLALIGLCCALLLGWQISRAQMPPVGFPPGTFLSRGAIDAASTPAYSGPGDKVSGASMWWGLRGYNAAFSGTVATICDGATGLVCVSATWSGGVLTIPLVGGVACNNTVAICDVSSLVDQTGNGFTLSQATNSKRPTLVVPGAANGCPTTAFPCMTFLNTSAQVLVTASGPTLTPQPFSGAFVGIRTGNTAAPNTAMGTGPTLVMGWNSTANLLRITAGTPQTIAGNDNSWHAAQGIWSNSVGSLSADGSTTTANNGPNVANAVAWAMGCSSTSAVCLAGNLVEAGVWPIAFSAQNISDLNSNAHTYWGF